MKISAIKEFLSLTIMKNAIKCWITNIFALIIWAISTTLFFLDKMELWPKYVISLAIGGVFFFLNAKTIRGLLINLINKKIG